MKQTIKTALVALGLTAAMAAPAFAQWGPGPNWGGGGPGPNWGGGGRPQERVVVPPGGGGCQAAAHRSRVTFQWHEMQQLCQGNWSDRPVRCVEDLQRYGIPVWQSIGVCRSAR